jgi:hypothetical protein
MEGLKKWTNLKFYFLKNEQILNRNKTKIKLEKISKWN